MRTKVIVMLLVLLVLMASFVAIPRPAVATISGDFGYSLINNDTAAVITSYSGSGTDLTIPDHIDGYPVVMIGSYALSYSHTLTQVIVPAGVTDIGNSAFYECDSLTSVTLPDSVVTIEAGAFYDCISLTSIVLPKNLTTIEGFAFFSCDLKSVSIPASITTIGDSVFGNCLNLTMVNLSEGLMEIGNGEFSSCHSLSSVTIPESVTSIGAGAFYDCRSLTAIEIPGNVTEVQNSAFQNCTGLTTVDLRNGLGVIDYAAFYGCSSLKSIAIPNSVDTLGYGAFYGCTELTSVTFESNVTGIGALTFYGCWSLTNVSVPDSVSIIGYGAFFDCRDISSVNMGAGVTSIGASAFGNCSSLTSIDFESIAPSLATDWIVNHNSDLTIHYRPGASGFTSPTWQGVPTESNGTALAAPQIVGVKPTSGTVAISWNLLSGIGSDAIDYYIVYQDGVDVLHVTSGTATISGLVNGRTYSFQISAHDLAGAGIRSTSFRAVPYASQGTLSVTITTPKESSFLQSGNVSVTWIVGGESSNTSYSQIVVDDATPVILSATDLSYQIHGFSEGRHTVNVTLVDAQGSLTSATVTFTVDTTAPTVIGFSPTGNGTSTRTSVAVKFSEEMDQTVTGIVIEGITGAVSWNGSTATLIPSSTLMGNTTYTVMLNGKDRSGNALPITNWTFTTANVGTISGRILDANNFPIVNATVILTRTLSVLPGMNDTWETHTDARGNYAFYDVAPGNYTLTSTKAGFDRTTENIAMTNPGIAVGGLRFDETISAQGSGGNGLNMGLIIGFTVVVVLLLLAFVSLKRKK